MLGELIEFNPYMYKHFLKNRIIEEVDFELNSLALSIEMKMNLSSMNYIYIGHIRNYEMYNALVENNI